MSFIKLRSLKDQLKEAVIEEATSEQKFHEEVDDEAGRIAKENAKQWLSPEGKAAAKRMIFRVSPGNRGLLVVFPILFVFLILLFLSALDYSGLAKKTSSIASGEVVPMGQIVTLKKETSLQDTTKIPPYRFGGTPGTYLQQFICSGEISIPISVPGHVILSNVNGVSVKIKSPTEFSPSSPLKITCNQPGIVLIAFYPEK